MSHDRACLEGDHEESDHDLLHISIESKLILQQELTMNPYIFIGSVVMPFVKAAQPPA